MVDKKVLIAGFAIGVAAGAGVLSLQANNARPSSTTRSSGAVAASSKTAGGNIGVDKIGDGYANIFGEAPSGPPTFQSMADQLSKSQGGISLHQLQVLSEIYGVATTYRDRQIGGHQMNNSSAANYGVLGAARSDPYAMLRSVSPQTMPSGSASRLPGSHSAIGYGQATGGIDNVFAGMAPPNIGAIEIGSGQYLAPAGPGSFVDPRNGTLYAPAGPNGVVNTRTGEFSPVNR